VVIGCGIRENISGTAHGDNYTYMICLFFKLTPVYKFHHLVLSFIVSFCFAYPKLNEKFIMHLQCILIAHNFT